MEDLNYPDIKRDMIIIGNHRLGVLLSFGLAPDRSEGGKPIPPFNCAPRGYLLSENGIVLLFDPEVFDIESSLGAIHDIDSPKLEVWILEDDEVVRFFELDIPEINPLSKI